MDCLMAQTRITSYVEGELTGNELKEFLLHMQQCSGCREELEIHYTLLEATRQLDEGILTTSDFMKELEDKMQSELDAIRTGEVRARQRKAFVSFLFICMMAIGAIKILDIPIPILNPKEITWEDEKEHITKYMIPYMYEAPSKGERLDK